MTPKYGDITTYTSIRTVIEGDVNVKKVLGIYEFPLFLILIKRKRYY